MVSHFRSEWQAIVLPAHFPFYKIWMGLDKTLTNYAEFRSNELSKYTTVDQVAMQVSSV